MIKLEDIPKGMRQERHDTCQKCRIRKSYAKRFDVHFDWVDCPYDCEHDYEHLEAELKDFGKKD